MAIGERIRYFRTSKGMTQKYLGKLVGFSDATADIRIAQYESGTRTPKAEIVNKLAEVFDVSPAALTVPDIDDINGIMQTLFALEDNYGFTATIREGVPVIYLSAKKLTYGLEINLSDWAKMADKYRSGEISFEEYDNWRYNLEAFTIRK